jgi:hypothetical protein
MVAVQFGGEQLDGSVLKGNTSVSDQSPLF